MFRNVLVLYLFGGVFLGGFGGIGFDFGGNGFGLGYLGFFILKFR